MDVERGQPSKSPERGLKRKRSPGKKKKKVKSPEKFSQNMKRRSGYQEFSDDPENPKPLNFEVES